MNKIIQDSFLIEQTKERIRRILPHVERLNIKVEMNPKRGYLTTIRFSSLGKDFVAKKLAPFYRESLERGLNAINSQVNKFRHKHMSRSTSRPEIYTTI